MLSFYTNYFEQHKKCAKLDTFLKVFTKITAQQGLILEIQSFNNALSETRSRNSCNLSSSQ